MHIFHFCILIALATTSTGYNHRIIQRLDGWYNNLGHPSWGSADSTLVRLSPAAYADGVYQISGQSRPNPQLVSRAIFKGPDGLTNQRNLTALFAFFGQVAAYEILMSNQYSCPIEIYHIPVEMCTNVSECHTMHMPFSRAEYDKKTGNSPNRPREQLNKVTSWIDASFVYNTKLVWLQAMRTFKDGRLETSGGNLFPPLNTKGVPMFNLYAPHQHSQMDLKETFVLGDPRVNENPPLLLFAILFMRWHNLLAENIREKHPRLSDQDIFNAARRWVIATMQNIIAYEYVPALLGEPLETYKGYNPDLYPGVSHEFQSAAFRYSHSLIPPGIYLRDKNCKFRKRGKNYTSIRLCNTWWDGQHSIKEYGVDEMIMGLASQLAERDDHILVSDLREKVFGPREFSRQDLVVLNIMRGRDSGLPDYNTMRQALQLPKVTEWWQINPELNKTNPKIIQKFAELFDYDLSNIDPYPAGMLETQPKTGPGPLFRKIIKSQFERIRDSDRFWFENPSSGIFNLEEIEFIKSITLYDIIVNVTGIGPDDIQRDLFHWQTGYPCKQPRQLTTRKGIEPCGYVQTYDYFRGNELSYILTCLSLCLSPLLCGIVAYLIVKRQSRRRKRLILNPKSVKNEKSKIQSNSNIDGPFVCSHIKSRFQDSQNPQNDLGANRRKSSDKYLDTLSCYAGNVPRLSTFSISSMFSNSRNYVIGYEWLNDNHRRKILLNLDEEGGLKVLNRKGVLLKQSSFEELAQLYVEINEISQSDPPVALIRNFDKYDLLLEFPTADQRDLFVCVKLVSSAHNINKMVEIVYTDYDKIFECALTKERKSLELDYFFRKVYAETFKLEDKNWKMQKTKDKKSNIDIEKSKAMERKMMESKLNKVEFADALGMKPSSLFVERMFAVIDKSKSGGICFQDFLDMTYIFANGTSEQKLRIMYDMFDINQKGELSKNEFFKLLRNFIECEQADDSEVHKCLSQMMRDAGLEGKQVLNFDDFVSLMSNHKAEFNSCGIHFKGAGKVFGSKVKSQRHDSFSLDEDGTDSTRGFIRKIYDATVSWIEENRQNIFYLIIFYAIVVGLFCEKMFRFCLLLEHTDLRRVMGAGICISRASANVISFVYCLLLITVCRHLITKLRETPVKKYVPLDSALAFHKLCAYNGIIFVVIHCAGHLINLYHVSTQPLEYLKCLFKEMFFTSNMPPSFTFWAFRTVPGLTGIILTLITVTMYVFAHSVVRRKAYRYFWSTHKLFIPFYALNVLHGSGRLTSNPTFHLYLIVPAILFTVDKLISLNRKYLEMVVYNATLLPSDVTKLVLNRPHTFTYKSGQWVQISIPDINPGEYHAFTLTSAPHQDTLSLHIKALGRWTWKVRNLYDPNNVQGTNYPRVYIDGPYGDGNQDWPNYEVVVMIGGGIGVTPYASILNDLVHSFYVNKHHNVACKKVYFLWVCPSHKSYEWFVNLLQDIKEKDICDMIDLHIFITQYFDRFDLRTTMLYICDKYFQNVANKSILTGLKATNHFGRPEFEKIFRYIQGKHKKCKKIGVFSCGPVALTSAIERSCDAANKNRETPILVSHFENFG